MYMYILNPGFHDPRHFSWRMVTCVEDPETGDHHATLNGLYDGPVPAKLLIKGEVWMVVEADGYEVTLHREQEGT